MQASVVVSTYNRRRSLERCLRSLLDQRIDRDSYEIIVVDDCSTDDTPRVLEHMASTEKNFSYVRHTENRGLSATRNDGIRIARGDIVIFVDDDILVDPWFVGSHLQHHRQCGDQPLAVVSNLHFASECIEGSNIGRYLQSRYLGCRPAREREGVDYSNLPPRFFAGGISSVSRESLIAVGLFDEGIRGYGAEDEKMGYLLSRAGVRIIFAEQAHALHYDKVSIERYKQKIVETTQGGYRVILEQIPDHFERTGIRFLLPIDWRRDSPNRILVKAGVQVSLNRLTVFLLEWWAIFTDRYSWLSCPWVYRLLVAGWNVHGLRLKDGVPGRLRYGEDETAADSSVEICR